MQEVLIQVHKQFYCIQLGNRDNIKHLTQWIQHSKGSQLLKQVLQLILYDQTRGMAIHQKLHN